MHSLQNRNSYQHHAIPSPAAHNTAGDLPDGHRAPLYSPAFCLQAIRTLVTMKAPGLKPVDFAVMAHLISALPEHEVSFISNHELAERLGCDRRTIADSYVRLKKAGWLLVKSNPVRASKAQGHKVIDRRPATVMVNFDKFPADIRKADPISEDAKRIAVKYYLKVHLGKSSKAAKFAKARGKQAELRDAKAMQAIISEFDGDVDSALRFLNFALRTDTDRVPVYKAAWTSLYELNRRRKPILAAWRK
jgi:hypothetical protein